MQQKKIVVMYFLFDDHLPQSKLTKIKKPLSHSFLLLTMETSMKHVRLFSFICSMVSQTKVTEEFIENANMSDPFGLGLVFVFIV